MTNTDLAVKSADSLPVLATSSASLMMDSASLDKMERLANMMATAKSTVPNHFKGSVGDCLAVVMQSVTWQMNPFAVAQKTFLVSGVLGYEAQLVSAVINNSGAVKDRFHFEWFGSWEKIIGKFKKVTSKTKKDDNGNFKEYIVPAWEISDEQGLGVRVWATIKGESEPRVLELLMTQARTRNSTLWTEDPKQQLAYLAQKRWARLYAPDVILGVYTPDELESFKPPVNMGNVDEVGSGAKEVDADQLLKEGWAKAAKGMTEFGPWFNGLPKSSEGNHRPTIEPHRAAMLAKAREVDSSRTIDAEVKAPKDSQVVITYAKVMESLIAAKNHEQLDSAADLIGEVSDPKQRAELTAKYEALQSTMQAE